MEITRFLSNLEANHNVVLSEFQASLTGRELYYSISEFAAELENSGFEKGSAALVRMTNSISSVIAFFGVLKAGGVVFVGNPYDPIPRVCQVIKQFGVECFFADKPSVFAVQNTFAMQVIESEVNEHLNGRMFSYSLSKVNEPAIAESKKALNPITDAQVAIFSSGTTGQPKAILHSARNVFINAQRHCDAVGLRSDDVIAGFLPIYYSYGLVANLIASLVKGSKFVFQARSSQLDPLWANENKISVLALTPYFGQRLDVDIPSLRMLTFGGDALSSEAANILKSKFAGCELYSTYGLTEAGPRVASWRFDHQDIPSGLIVPLGEPLAGCELELLSHSDDATDLGELVVKTSTRTLGYFYGVERGVEMPDWPEGKVKTGDLFMKTNEHFYFVSRDKEMIVQNGEKLFPPVIESIIRHIDGVIDVRVEGIFDQEKGQIARAKIHADIEIPASKLRRSLLKELPHASIPADFVFVDHIERSATGKKLTKAVKHEGQGTEPAV
ncbi:class I adenylate-forming enzyme family protein [Litoribacillus peritrichatus]|uniref:AMP-binding protein n=1 Tax=Litoribacillus peritrichatus TaxID=718191 RepID=A0ABP7MA73_9GAMM